MDLFHNLLQQQIELNTTDNKRIYGILLDIGTDVILLYNGEDFIYISTMQIKKVRKSNSKEITMKDIDTVPVINHLSLRKVLTDAKGVFAEINTGTEFIHGYVTSILNDYFVFYSPVYKTLFIPIKHLKWFIPYQRHQTPYSLKKDKLPVNPINITLARTFDIQVEKLVGRIVVLNLGLSTDKIGQVRNIAGNYMELVTARGDTLFIHMGHIKSVHFQ